MKNNGQILLIDDNTAELQLYYEAIKDLINPTRVFSYDHPEAALEHIKKNMNKIFIIICDISMPLMTGIELLKQINRDRELKMQAVPFIFISNSDNIHEVEQAYELAAQGYFQKPYSLEELTKIFKTIIEYWSIARIPRTLFAM